MTRPRAPMIPKGSWPVFATIALSGMTALGAEVIWTRLLTLLLGGTVYTFSLILAAFLSGLGMGSSAGAALAKTVKNPRTALGMCQLLLVVALAWAAYSQTTALAELADESRAGAGSHGHVPDRRDPRAVGGAARRHPVGNEFPAGPGGDRAEGPGPGRLVASVYAANTVGAIFGAMLASLVALATLGTQGQPARAHGDRGDQRAADVHDRAFARDREAAGLAARRVVRDADDRAHGVPRGRRCRRCRRCSWRMVVMR